MWVILWIVFAVICGVFGADKKIGAVGAFFIALLLSPIIGFIVVLASDSKTVVTTSKWKQLQEEAEIEKYKGNVEKAIDKYKEAMYYLEKRCEQVSGRDKMQYMERLDGLKMIVKNLSESKT